MRSIWKGSIGFGLVNIPIKLYTAVESTSIDLDMLDEKDHSKIRFKRINENTNKEVPYNQIVKAYKLDDNYIILDDKDFADASPVKTKLIEIESFVNTEEINLMYYESSFFAEPDAKNSKAYILLLQALKKSGKVGVGRFVLRTKENLCIIHPLDNVIAITRIRFENELRKPDDLKLPDTKALPKKEIDMALSLIEQYQEKFDISKFKDTYNDDLLKIIKAKAKGKRATVKKLKAVSNDDDSLYDTLMKSLKSNQA